MRDSISVLLAVLLDTFRFAQGNRLAIELFRDSNVHVDFWNICFMPVPFFLCQTSRQVTMLVSL